MTKERAELIRKLTEQKLEDCTAELVDVDKVNGTCHGLRIRRGNSKVAPCIYFDHIPEGGSPEETTDALITVFKRYEIREDDAMEQAVKNLILDKVELLSHVLPAVCNTEKNEMFLKKLVKRDFIDLTIYYYVPINTEEMDGSWNMTLEAMDYHELTEEEVHMAAIMNLNQQIWERNMAEYMPLPYSNAETNMYILSNERLCKGAAMMLSKKMPELAEKYEGDMLVIPSSVNEIIVLPAADADIDVIKDVIRCVNRSTIDPSEFLSDNAYIYDRDNDCYSIAG